MQFRQKDGYMKQKRVLILCTGNSCRSQMAEGLINRELKAQWVAFSAGTRPSERVHPLAIRVMAELGIDISGARPKHVEVFLGDDWDLVITVCDSAAELCPVFPRKVRTIHIGFSDPAGASGSQDDVKAFFRRVRDDIRRALLPVVEKGL